MIRAPIYDKDPMDQTTPAGDRPDLQPVLQAAMRLVEANGLRGLSLRPLAEHLGLTVSALSHRFGLKDELVGALIEAAVAQDVAFLDRWLDHITAMQVRHGALMAEVADAILSDLAGPEGLRTRFYCELLQGAATRPELAPAVAAWSARRLAFWRAACAGLGPAAQHAPDLGQVLHAFSIGEAAYGLAIGDLAAYRWLRRLNLRRLCCGLIPADNTEDLRQYDVFRAALSEREPSGGWTPTAWQAKVAGHISALIIAEGADAVTHRAIAARAGLANSTLAYHFPRQEDLLRAGMADVSDRVRRVAAPGPGEASPEYQLTSIETARATFALALVVGRLPELKAATADLRRRRGENYVGYIARERGAAAIDVVSAQAVSVTGTGRLILEATLDPAGNQAAFQLTDQMVATALARG